MKDRQDTIKGYTNYETSDPRCVDCAFEDDMKRCMLVNCDQDVRQDKKNVVFMKDEECSKD